MGTPKPQTTIDAFPELSQWMADTDTTQADLASLLQISQSQMSRYLAGQMPFPMERAIKISLITGVPVEKLLNGREASRLLKLLGKRENSGSEDGDDSANVG